MSIALRVQRLREPDRVLVLSELAQARLEAPFSPQHVEEIFSEAAIPRPNRLSNSLQSLERSGFVTRRPGRGAVWLVTPEGRHRVTTSLAEMDIAALDAELRLHGATLLGGLVHPLVPTSLAPPGILGNIDRFLEQHPFETNVFGMTRFPSEGAEDEDPVGAALEAARRVCYEHGLELHLASDRAMSQDLWENVAGHMWASKFGIAILEERFGPLNHNVAIEVGGMLMSGRRCALLKDGSINKIPTDLVGKIYKPVDLDNTQSVSDALNKWIDEDLAILR